MQKVVGITQLHAIAYLFLSTVDSEIFARTLFSRITLKGIFVTLKIRDLGMIYLYQ